MNMTYSKKTMIWSLCAALCIVLPQTMRVIPNAELSYKAMQIPVLLCGILCGPGGGLFCALTAVIVSAFITGIPAAPMFPVVFTELALMGIISGCGVKFFGKSRRERAVVYSLVLAVLLGRAAAGLTAAVLFSPGRQSIPLWIWGYIIVGLPSFIIQLVLLPAIIRVLDYSGLVSEPVPTGADNASQEQLTAEETVEEVVEEPTEEVAEEPTEEVVEEPTEEVVEEPTEEVAEEPTEEVAEEPTEEVVEEPTEEVVEEPTEEVAEETTEESNDESTEETTEETVAGTAENQNK